METQAAQLDHMPRLKNQHIHQQNHMVTAAAASGSHKKASSDTHPKYAVMIRDAIVLMKQRNGTSALGIAKAIETRHKSHLPSNFRKMLQLQLRKLVRAGRLVKDKSRFRCTPSFKKNPEATPRSRASLRKKKKTKAKTKTKAKKKKAPARRRRKVVRTKRRRRSGNKKKKQRRSRSRTPASGSSRRRRASSSRGRKRKASSLPARKKTRPSKSRKSTPRKRQATRRNNRYYK